MKIVSVKQNSKAWREWRGTGLGASDAPAYMGESPWVSPFELWLEKTGLMQRPAPNEFQVAAMKRGIELEPVVREMFEKKMGVKFEPIAAEHPEHEFLRASFDGYNKDLNAILEIKCPNKDDHTKALKGKVPDKYVSQLSQQFLISGCEKGFYCSWDGKSEELAIVEVKPDKEHMDQLLATAIDFWARVVHKKLPEVREKDVFKLINEMQSSLEKVNRISGVLKLLTGPEGK